MCMFSFIFSVYEYKEYFLGKCCLTVFIILVFFDLNNFATNRIENTYYFGMYFYTLLSCNFSEAIKSEQKK
jgi:hypothetical protein